MLYWAYYFSCSASAKLLHLGVAEPLNYGLSMPPEWLGREMGNAETFCGTWQSCSSSQRAGGLQADCWQTECSHPAAS